MIQSMEQLAPRFTVCRLEHLAAVRLTGADAASFLHGQVTSDIEGLAEHGFVAAAYCNPKGRALALLRVIRTGPEEFLLVTSRDLVEPVVKRLRMYVLRAKAVFEPLDWALFGLPDDGTASAFFDTLPERGEALPTAGGIVVNTGAGANRYVHIAPSGEAPGDVVSDADASAWLGLQAVDGIAEIFADTSETFLPQAINLDLVGAVNYRKGCYPGQEIVARLHYLGRLKQRMVRVVIRGAVAEPGQVVTSGGTKIGQVVLCGSSSHEGVALGLASVNFGQLDRDAAALEGGARLEVLDPDYAVPEFDTPAVN